MIESKGGFLIGQIKQIQARVFNQLLQQAGIEEFNGAQGRILYVLWQEDGLIIREIANRTGLAKTTLTSMLNRMEEQGFIMKTQSTDGRQSCIQLTQKARDLSDKYDEVSNRMTEIFYEGFEEEEIIMFEKTLERIKNHLQKVEKENE